MEGIVQVVLEVLKYAGAPAAMIAFVVIWDRVRDKRNGVSAKDIAEALRPHLDVTITNHFVQLQKDLRTTIEHAMTDTSKSMENTITRLLLQSEVQWWRDKR